MSIIAITNEAIGKTRKIKNVRKKRTKTKQLEMEGVKKNQERTLRELEKQRPIYDY